jgi:tetratricopeptide (TPR) repeat protein
MAAMQESITLSERVGFIPPQATTRSDLALVYANLGDLDRANELLDIALRVVNEQQPISRPSVMGAKAELLLLAGELDEARSAAQGSQFDLLPEPLRSGASIRVAILRGRIAAAEGDHAGAIRIAAEVLSRLRSRGIRQFVPAALLLHGTSLASLGRWPEAERVLREARSEALGFRWVKWEILRELGRVLASNGNAAEAADARSEAAGIVRLIADSIEDERLRVSFLERPGVRAVLSGP